jgi:hypothetical protein
MNKMDKIDKIKTLKELQIEDNANGTIKDFPGDNTDPKRMGPGYWHCIHTLALDANTDDKQKQFIDIMKKLCEKFPCHICAGHCKEYIEKNNMENYIGVTVEIGGENKNIGLFIWSWKFHNAVNFRTKKPLMSWDTAYNLFSNTKNLHMCSAKCLETEDNNVENNNVENNNVENNN